MWKPKPNNKTFPTGLPPMEGQHRKTQYTGWHKDTTRKGMWIGEDNEVPKEDRDVWGNIEIIGGWRDHQVSSSL